MEELSVSTPVVESAPSSANVFAFAPEEDASAGFGYGPEDGAPVEPVDAAPGASEAERASEDEPAEDANGLEEGVDGQQLDGKPQKRVGAAFAKESARLRAKYEKELASDPDRAIGRRLVEDLMARDHLSEADARKTLDDRWTAAYAQRAGIPEDLARDILSLKQQTKPKADDFDPDTRAAEIRSEIESMTLPDGFDANAAYADPVFAELLLEMPTAAAVRVYHAEHKAQTASARADNAARDVAEKLRARGQIPMAEVPTAPVRPRVDYRSMTSEEFWAEKQRREKQNR